MSKKEYVYVVDGEFYDIFRKKADKKYDTDADIEMYSATQDKWVPIKRSEFDKLFKHYPFMGTEYFPPIGEDTVEKMTARMKEYIKDNEAPISWKNTAFKDFDI